jgi:hypothetical protein
MWRQIVCRTISTLSFVLLPGLASADSPEVPKYVHELQGQLGQCKPSCYKKESAKPFDVKDLKKVCGWIDYGFESRQLKNGAWTPLQWLGESVAQPEVIKPCKLPADTGGKWAPFVNQAKHSMNPDDKSTRFVVQGDWTYSRDDTGTPTRRVSFRVYAPDYNMRPNECGGFDKVVCEASGSKTALAINYIHARVDEGKKLAADGNNKMCMVATFTAVATARGIKKFRDAKIKSKGWSTGLTYQTRQDGSIAEKELFAKIDQIEHEAEELHHKCGGASPLVTEVPHKTGHSAPEFYVVPYPED